MPQVGDILKHMSLPTKEEEEEEEEDHVLPLNFDVPPLLSLKILCPVLAGVNVLVLPVPRS